MILRVTGVPPSLNKVLRMHWTKRSQLLSMWVWMVRTAFGKPALTSEKMRVKITLHHSRFYDKDNAYGACKVIFDALKAEGHIVDDSPSWLESTVEQVKCKRIEANTTIELEPSGGILRDQIDDLMLRLNRASVARADLRRKVKALRDTAVREREAYKAVFDTEGMGRKSAQREALDAVLALLQDASGKSSEPAVQVEGATE